MKIAIMGAGAVGCYYGGMLARAGHEVVLIGRAHHIAAIAEHGLLLDTQEFRESVKLLATTEVSSISPVSLVLCCVKATDTEQAGQQMAPWLAPDALVLSLQNGVDNAERLAALLPCPVEPAVVYVAAEMAAAGHVKHHGGGELILSSTLCRHPLSAAFVAAGIPIEHSNNVTGTLWAKLVLNCVYNATSAITQLPYGELVQVAGMDVLMHCIYEECRAVADAMNICLPVNLADVIAGIAHSMPTQVSSTAQDLTLGRRTEIDHLNGFIVRRGAAMNIPTPINEALQSLVKALEQSASQQIRLT